MVNIEIQQNILISIGKDPKYIKGTTGKIVEQIIFRKYPERTIKREDIEKGSLGEKLLKQCLELERKRKIKEGRQVIKKNCRRMSQINESEIEDIMIEIQRMSLNETKDVNPIGHIGGPSKIKKNIKKHLENNIKYLNMNQKKQKLNN